MTIAELLIRIGIKVEGGQKLATSDRELKQATISATKFTLSVAALNAAFLTMIGTSMHVATALRNFALSTGLSTDELQQWQRAAQMAGLSATGMSDAILGLQNARVNFQLGEPEAVGAWTLLGIDPRQDPFKVIEALREKLKDVKDVGLARNLLGRVGLEEMLPLLRSTNIEFDKWKKSFLITSKQQEQLGRLTQAWASLRAAITSIRVQFSALFVPALVKASQVIEWTAGKFAVFVRWLERGGIIATPLRWALEALGVLLPIIALGIAAVVAGLTALVALFGLIAAGAAAAAFAPILVPLAAIAAWIADIILLADDMWNAITGKKSLIGDLGVKVFGPLFQGIKDFWDASEANRKKMLEEPDQRNLLDLFRSSPTKGLASPGNVRQENNVSIQVDGARDPRETGREVSDSVRREISSATYQMPVPSY